MSASASVPIRDAVILAAGNGDRFQSSHHDSKLLHPVLGRPLLLRTVETAVDAGLTTLTIVLGYQADRVRELIARHPIPGTVVRYVYNPDWRLENGVSALHARPYCIGDRFALLMGDHLFEPVALRRLASAHLAGDDSALAIDRGPVDPLVAAEATKVQLDGDRIVAIGKTLRHWDAIDTGLFVFSPSLFDALEDARQAGETTLSAGVQRLAARGLMRGVSIGNATWRDVDTLDDLEAAEALFGAAAAESA